MNLLIFNRFNFRYLFFASLFLLMMVTGSFAHADEGDFYFMVNSTADLSDINPGDEICEASNGLCTLRAAIEEGNVVSDGDATEITVPAGNYQINSQLIANDTIIIIGAGKSATIIDGQGVTAVLHVQTPTADEMLVCDQSGRSVIRYNDNGQPIEDFINQDGFHSTWWPTAVDIGSDGNVFVATKFNGIFEYRQSGFQLDKFIAYKDFPWDNLNMNIVDGLFAPSPARGYFVADQLENHEIVRFNETNGQKVIYRISGQQELKKPDSLAFYNDDLFVSDIESNNVQRYNALTGAFIEVFVDQASGGLDNPRGIVFKNDILYVANEGSDSVLRFDAQTGASLGSLIPSGSGGLDAPDAIGFGPNGNFYVLSKNTNEILRYDGTTGAFIDVFIQTDSVYLEDPACFKWYEKSLDSPYVNLRNLTIQNGYTQNPDDGSSGLHVDQGATVNLRNVVIQNNISSFEGGGLYNKGKLRIDDSDILNNSIPFSNSGGLSRGGGLFNAGQLGIYNSLVANNSADSGGGIANVDAGLINITNSTISQNNALSGGGIRNTDFAKLNVNHSTIAQNTVNGPGGQEGVARLGGGIYNDGSARIRLGNSILAENNDYRAYTDPDFSPDCFSAAYGIFESRGHNIIGINSNTCYINGLPSDQNGNGNNPLNPMLDTLANRVHMPLAGSPAIDGGLATPEYLNSVQTYFCVADDQNNQVRPIDGDINGESRCDIGAAEYVPAFIIDPSLIYVNWDWLKPYFFGPIELGDVSKNQLEIINKGDRSVEVKELDLPEGFETLDRFAPFAIEPGEKAELTIAFNPADYGTYRGEMSLTIGEHRFQWTLVGEATKPDSTEIRTETSTKQK